MLILSFLRQPLILAMQLGASSAMQLGLADSALSFYQTVLKFDPEQERVRAHYRGLKNVLKLMDKAEKEVSPGKTRRINHSIWTENLIHVDPKRL
jgi:hypothetical protein